MRFEAALALLTSDPSQRPAWRARIAELSLRKDHLRVEPARLDVTFRGEQAEAGRAPDQLQATLPRGTALIDLPGFPVEECWYATLLERERRSTAASALRRFLGTPEAMQLMRSPAAGVPPSRFKPPVYVTIWS